MRLLITGASGFIGSRLAAAALAQGESVRTLTRREWSGAPLVPLTARFFGELPFDIPPQAVAETDVVVHCATSISSDLQVARAVNVVGMMRLAEAARQAGVRAFVMLSSQSARADAAAAYGQSKFEAEQALLSLSGLETVVLRPGLVVGRGGLFGRIAASVERLPVVPVVGAESAVQPIYVGDLVEAILRIAEHSSDFDRAVLQLGTPEAMRLGDLVALVAGRTAGRRKYLAPVPTGALAVAVKGAERVGIPLPVNSSNVAGMRAVRVMDTRADMQRLGVPDRAPADIVQLALADGPPQAPGGADRAGVNRPADTLLVGTGRIGLVHAITLSRLPAAFLAGVADRSPAARRLLRSTGVLAPGHDSLDAALAERKFDAVVIATPPASHLALARQCAQQGLAVLIEKPACLGPEQIAAFECLADETHLPLLVGYLMPGMPHIQGWLERLKRGELGQITRFDGFSLLSLMLEPSSQRWETRKEVSGGGVLANSSGHVLSLIREAFGAPSNIVGQTRRVVSGEVEDAAIVQLDYDGFAGSHYSSWCIPGFPRQENRLVVETDRGVLFLTISMGVFVDRDGSLELTHQLDHDVGFNLAPDYAGGGIARELNDLSGRNGPAAAGSAMTLSKALGVERLLFDVYAAAKDVSTFAPPAIPPAPFAVAVGPAIGRVGTAAGHEVPQVLDLRDLELSSTGLRSISPREWPEVAIFSDALQAAGANWPSVATRVTMPNLLHQTRLIGDKRYLQLVRSLGPRGLLGSARHGALAVLRQRNAGFWVAVTGLLAGELAALPSSFDGTILLHPYVVDLAVALDELASLNALLRIVRRERPRARVGLHSNLARAAANATAMLSEPVDVLSVLTSPSGKTLAGLRDWLQAVPATRSTQLTAEVGPAPLVVHRLARSEPGRWSADADGLLIGGLAEPLVLAQLSPAVRERWAASFGSISMPESVW